MDVRIGHIEAKRTARYCTLGEPGKMNCDIWVVLHGYGVTSDVFIKNFSQIADKGNYIVAPEGTSRFYVKGTSGLVGTSWMTKVDRDNEIRDYVGYLDLLYRREVEPHAKDFSGKVIALGFSQGASTLSRWAASGGKKLDRLIFWCGSFPEDVSYSGSDVYKKADVHLVFSSKDRYITPESRKKQEELLGRSGIVFRTHIFEGVHEVSDVLLNAVGLA